MKQRIVIKLGGSSLQNDTTLKELAALVKGYQKRRYSVVLVHGGGPAINQELTAQKMEWKFIDGQRQTTPQMMTVIEKVLAGDVNKMVVEKLREEKIAAVGLSGAAHEILFCTPATAELMQVGQVQSANVQLIEILLNEFGAKVPVIAPIGYGVAGQKFNVNADGAATQIALALKAKMLIFLTDQSGILDQQKKLVPRATAVMIDQMIEDGVISGGMFTKVNAMMTAVSGGVKKVRVLHASFASSILQAGSPGTVLTNGVRHGRAS